MQKLFTLYAVFLLALVTARPMSDGFEMLPPHPKRPRSHNVFEEDLAPQLPTISSLIDAVAALPQANLTQPQYHYGTETVMQDYFEQMSEYCRSIYILPFNVSGRRVKVDQCRLVMRRFDFLHALSRMPTAACLLTDKQRTQFLRRGLLTMLHGCLTAVIFQEQTLRRAHISRLTVSRFTYIDYHGIEQATIFAQNLALLQMLNVRIVITQSTMLLLDPMRFKAVDGLCILRPLLRFRDGVTDAEACLAQLQFQQSKMNVMIAYRELNLTKISWRFETLSVLVAPTDCTAEMPTQIDQLARLMLEMTESVEVHIDYLPMPFAQNRQDVSLAVKQYWQLMRRVFTTAEMKQPSLWRIEPLINNMSHQMTHQDLATLQSIASTILVTAREADQLAVDIYVGSADWNKYLAFQTALAHQEYPVRTVGGMQGIALAGQQIDLMLPKVRTMLITWFVATFFMLQASQPLVYDVIIKYIGAAVQNLYLTNVVLNAVLQAEWVADGPEYARFMTQLDEIAKSSVLASVTIRVSVERDGLQPLSVMVWKYAGINI